MKKYIYILLFAITPFSLAAQMQITKAYVQQYKDIAMKEMKRTGIPASITLAQAIVESSSGESNLAKKFNNHFGIKCKLEWKGETTYQDDDSKQECFRVYPNAESSFIDHSNFLKNRPNYASLFELDPVDDTAWAYGLKKAGYATASDYPKKILKVIDDYELAQYNYPELANEPNDTAAEDTVIATLHFKQTVGSASNTQPNMISNPTTTTTTTNNNNNNNTTTATTNTNTTANNNNIVSNTNVANNNHVSKSSTTNNIVLNKIQGVAAATVASTSSLASMQGIGSTPIETNSSITTPVLLEQKSENTKTAPTLQKKSANNYPINTKFKVNHIPAIWAVSGRSFLEIANTYQVPLYKLYQYNELHESDLVVNDQLIFLREKKKESNNKVHVVKEGESLYDISQVEGIQFKWLKTYNPEMNDAQLTEGKIIYLFSLPKDPSTNQNNKSKEVKTSEQSTKPANSKNSSSNFFQLPIFKKKK